MARMNITIHSSMLPHQDAEASLAFYRDTLGFEVRNDVEYGGMHWITVGPADQPGTSIVLYPPEATPGLTDDERRTIAEMMAKGTYASLNLATRDLDATFERPPPAFEPETTLREQIELAIARLDEDGCSSEHAEQLRAAIDD